MKKYLFLVLLACTTGISAQRTPLKPTICIVESIDHDSLLAAAGYTGLVESISRRISPRSVSEEVFRENLRRFQGLETPLYAVNLFLPGDLKVLGPEVKEQAVLAYVDSLLQRVSQTGARLIVWGSGASRRIPEGFDRKTANRQFVYMAKKMAAVAAKYQIVLALENLNASECNFITTVAEALAVVKEVDHPNLRLNADIYHMLKEGEGPAILKKTKKYLVYVELAEAPERTAPGVHGTNFKPYLLELYKIRYHQKIGIEGRWKNVEDIAVSALQYLQNQIDAVYQD